MNHVMKQTATVNLQNKKIIKSRNILYLLIILVIGTFAHTNVLAVTKESRMIFDENFSWLTSKNAGAVLHRINTAGFNVIVPSVWHGRGTSWPSLLAPKEPRWERVYKKGYDPLKELITKAHGMGIEVHPSFTVALRQREFLNNFYDSKNSHITFNIHLPEFREYMVDLILEVVNNYDIDGVNLDYIRSIEVCKSVYCIDDYKKKYNRYLLSDIKKSGRFGKEWQAISDWNANAVNQIVAEISARVRSVKPGLVLSVDSHAGRKRLMYQGTNSVAWANAGLINVIFHMDYGQKINMKELDQGLDMLNDPGKLVLFVGNYERKLPDKKNVWPRDAQKVAELLKQSQRINMVNGGNGVALYEYTFLTEEQIDKIKSGPFKDNATPSWKLQHNAVGETP